MRAPAVIAGLCQKHVCFVAFRCAGLQRQWRFDHSQGGDLPRPAHLHVCVSGGPGCEHQQSLRDQLLPDSGLYWSGVPARHSGHWRRLRTRNRHRSVPEPARCSGAGDGRGPKQHLPLLFQRLAGDRVSVAESVSICLAVRGLDASELLVRCWGNAKRTHLFCPQFHVSRWLRLAHCLNSSVRRCCVHVNFLEMWHI